MLAPDEIQTHPAVLVHDERESDARADSRAGGRTDLVHGGGSAGRCPDLVSIVLKATA
jgi:hypothetical protein